jgi:peptidoglycan/LPS O-acetylase OafA/YrhL
MLSGFVMTYVYQERMDAGWSTWQFMRTRLLRLYPLYILGFTLGATFAVLWAHFGRLETSKPDMAALMLLGLLLLPAPPRPLLPTA